MFKQTRPAVSRILIKDKDNLDKMQNKTPKASYWHILFTFVAAACGAIISSFKIVDSFISYF